MRPMLDLKRVYSLVDIPRLHTLSYPRHSSNVGFKPGTFTGWHTQFTYTELPQTFVQCLLDLNRVHSLVDIHSLHTLKYPRHSTNVGFKPGTFSGCHTQFTYTEQPQTFV